MIVDLFGAPVCPRCDREARQLEIDEPHDVDLFSSFKVTHSRRTYTIRPCGHEVVGFKVDTTRVLEWSLTPY